MGDQLAGWVFAIIIIAAPVYSVLNAAWELIKYVNNWY